MQRDRQQWLAEAGDAVAVVLVRDGRLPGGALAAATEAGGVALVIGSGAEVGAGALRGARRAFWAETGPGLQPARLAATVAEMVRRVPLVVLPSTPDGRDLAPRLAATLGRPLLAGAVEVACHRREQPGGHTGGADGDGQVTIRATLSRLDDRVQVPVEVAGPAVATVLPWPGADLPNGAVPTTVEHLGSAGEQAARAGGAGPDPEILAMLEPDVRTMDLTEARRVVAGGGGLAAGADDQEARARFEQLRRVAAAIGASSGATRVATDAGWADHQRQIGTTGVSISPDLYVAFGIAGATQHVGGLVNPRHVISVNTDAACPMTAMADLGLITDAPGMLAELARRFDVTATSVDGTAVPTVGDG